MIDQEIIESGSFQFNEAELKAAKFHIDKYPVGRQASAVMPLLDIAQRQIGGWLPRVAMDYVEDLLEMPRIRVYEVASFYTMYNLEPIGQYHVQICTNLPCWLRGSDQIKEAIKLCLGIEKGRVTKDGIFTLSEVECLGACVNAPMMQINDDYFEDLDEASVQSILTELKNGKVPKTGSQIDRTTCEPIGGLTSLVQSSRD